MIDSLLISTQYTAKTATLTTKRNYFDLTYPKSFKKFKTAESQTTLKTFNRSIE